MFGCSQRQDAMKSSKNFVVVHTPNPCDTHHSEAFKEDPFPYMWYYRTEVRNFSAVPLRIVWFEGYSQINGTWVANNVKKRLLTGKDFVEWYSDGSPCPGGVIQPGTAAVCDPSWHGSDKPQSGPMKWAYKAVDPSGREYYAEAIVTSVPIK